MSTPSIRLTLSADGVLCLGSRKLRDFNPRFKLEDALRAQRGPAAAPAPVRTIVIVPKAPRPRTAWRKLGAGVRVRVIPADVKAKSKRQPLPAESIDF